MAKQATITEIARKAGVSIGTVDRVLHHRGGVSSESRRRVQAILDEVGYKIHLHTSAVALRKQFRLVVTIPEPGPGTYWDKLLDGVRKAVEEYSDIPITLLLLPYDQGNPASCREVFVGIPETEADAVIIGPTFDAETHALCAALDAAGTPYVFVDTAFPDTRPLSSFTADQPAGGALVAKLLHHIVPPGKSIVEVHPSLGGGAKAQNAVQRRRGFLRYFADCAPERKVLESERDYLGADVGGVCVLNSRGSRIADAILREGRTDIKVVAFDLTDENLRCLREGSIFALVCQRPERQGFLSVTTLLEYLLYHHATLQQHVLMPLDIVLKENLDYYFQKL